MAVAPVPYQAPRAQRSGRTLIFVIGAGMAVVAFIAVFVIGALLASSNSASHQVTAVVALQDINPRVLITASSVALRQVPAASLPPHSMSLIADVQGKKALVTIYKGQVLSQNLIASAPDQINYEAGDTLPIPKGFVALTIPTDEQQGVAGYIAAGDYIDITATMKSVSKTVFAVVWVIRVGPPTQGPKEGQQQGVSSSLTIVATQCDAQYLAWLINNASLKYSLLSSADYAPTPAAADASCSPTAVPDGVIGPAQVAARWGFPKA